MSQPRLTTASGIPVADNQNSLTAGPRGPVLLQDFHLIEKLQHFNRERIPERVVHAKGSGAYGTFTVTHDITRFTRAKLFERIGKETEVFLRFSTVGGEKGSADPVEMYLNDIFTVTVNMAGLPGIAVPAGKDAQGLPLGLQLIGRPFDEETLFSLGEVIEQAAGHFTPEKWW